MSKYNNSAKIFTGSTGGELRISLKNTRQTINATNNRAQYYAELAEKYKNEAKEHRDNAQYYAEQNSDVTFEYIDSVKESLEGQIATKQDNGDYALKSELPTKVSELNNDLEYTSFDAVIPSQSGNENKVLCTDGEKLFWNTNSSYKLFDTKTFDYILNYEESQGWALQGTYVYKEALAGTRYGYPDFYAKCLEEYNQATNTELINGVNIKVNANGHKFYDIVNKSDIDNFFNTMGFAWFYGIDIENERIFLPRNNYFEQATADLLEVGQCVEAGLPNITGTWTNGAGLDGGFIGSGALKTISNPSSYGGGHTTTTGTCGLGFDASLSNQIYGSSSTVQPNAVKKLLYICVGNTTNYEGVSEVINNGMDILKQVNQGIETRVKLDGSNAAFPYIKETYVNGNSWYRVYSDGWCEQGGFNAPSSNVYEFTVNLLKPYLNTDYTILATSRGIDSQDYHYDTASVAYSSVTKTSFKIARHTYSTTGSYWKAYGYIA